MIENAIVLVIVVGVVVVADVRGRSPRSLWPITYVALISLVAGVSFWALLPHIGGAIRASITVGAFMVVALTIVNLAIERRKRGWSN